MSSTEPPLLYADRATMPIDVHVEDQTVTPNQPLVRARIRLLLAAALLVAPVLAERGAAAPRIDGLWDAIVVVNGVEIPFRFELATRGSGVEGFFFEGERKIGSTAGSFDN